MAFTVKLKEGFFKTRRYNLMVGRKEIRLQPHDGIGEELVISENDLKSACLRRRHPGLGEFEINTQNTVYCGTFIPETDIEEVYQVLIREFSYKVRLLQESG